MNCSWITLSLQKKKDGKLETKENNPKIPAEGYFC